MEKLICMECKQEIPDDSHNYGTPEYPCCIHCYDLARREQMKDYVISGEAKTRLAKVWERYLKSK